MELISYKKIFAIFGLSAFVVVGISATKKPEDDKPHKNLKVLSKDISDDQLETVMYSFERQLGVTCLYCHVSTKNVTPQRVDFASDEKPEKKIAREMLKMTLKINKKYFNTNVDRKVNEVKPIVWCKTCHRGYPVPNVK